MFNYSSICLQRHTQFPHTYVNYLTYCNQNSEDGNYYPDYLGITYIKWVAEYK